MPPPDTKPVDEPKEKSTPVEESGCKARWKGVRGLDPDANEAEEIVIDGIKI